MEELGFVRNESARQLRTGTSKTLALMLIEGFNPYFNEVTRGIEDFVYADDWTLFVASSAADIRRERNNLEAFEQRRVQGIMINPTSDETLARIDAMQQRGISCVLIDRYTDQFSIPSVSVDNVAGGSAAGQHLIELGRTRILFAGNTTIQPHVRERLLGLERIANDGVSIELRETPALDFASGNEVGDYVSSLPARRRPDAVFAGNDVLAIGIMQSLIKNAIRIPEDIALIGYDDISFASQTAISLTSVRQPAYELGRRAASLLVDEITGASPKTVRRIVFQPELVARESTLGIAPRA
jgi:LacI family transcriptional regulator